MYVMYMYVCDISYTTLLSLPPRSPNCFHLYIVYLSTIYYLSCTYMYKHVDVHVHVCTFSVQFLHVVGDQRTCLSLILWMTVS